MIPLPRQHQRHQFCVVAAVLAISGCMLLALALGPNQAAAAKRVTWTLQGAGFGHGIGMSQYGAQGYAQHGRNYKQILAHYYTGTDVRQTATKIIRVILRQGVRSVKVRGATQATGNKRLNPAVTYRVTRRSGAIGLYRGRTRIGSYSGGLLLTDGVNPLRLYGTAIGGERNGDYRGGLNFSGSALGGMNVVNSVDLDAYLQGVVPGEMPSSWQPEALKVQAVAARSYALATDAGGALFDQYPDTRSQVYRGADAEVASTNRAVQATSGEVVTYHGKVIAAFFSSTSGGQTEDVQNVFTGSAPAPYLTSVKDPYDNISPSHRWVVRYSNAALQARLGKLVKGRLKSIRVVKRGVSPRIISAYVYGTRGRVKTDGATLRARLGLMSTWVRFKRSRR